MSHYATLGVANTATPEEIKSAYRKLAKQHHPDLGGDVAKFQAISEAYEILSDPDKRSHYDYSLKNSHPQPNNFHFHGDPDVFNQINEHFSQMFGFNFAQARQVPRNRNIRIQLDLEFLDTLDICQKTIQYNLSNGTETITLDLPAGIQDQTVLQLAGRGDNANTAVPRGHLEVIVRVKPHNKFTKVDDHVLTEVTIDCFHAILGQELDMDTPRGKRLRLNIPAGIQSGTQLGITDEGFVRPNKTMGKLIVRVNVKIPTALTREQIELVKQITLLKPINT